MKKNKGTRKFEGILDWSVIKTHHMKDASPEENKQIVRGVSNFEKAHLKAYLKGYKYFTYHGQVYEVKEKKDVS